jgi:dihydrofolate reductase
MRKVILYIAQSLDGFIAGEDGDISWLSIVETPGEDYGYGDFIKTVDTVIMGRKTYDKVLSFWTGFPHRDRKCYVVSSTRKGRDENAEFYSGKIGELIESLKKEEGGNIFIDGGAEVVRELREENRIDEYVISILPVFIGKGVRLFADTERKADLELLECRRYDSGLVQLKYCVIQK